MRGRVRSFVRLPSAPEARARRGKRQPRNHRAISKNPAPFGRRVRARAKKHARTPPARALACAFVVALRSVRAGWRRWAANPRLPFRRLCRRAPRRSVRARGSLKKPCATHAPLPFAFVSLFALLPIARSARKSVRLRRHALRAFNALIKGVGREVRSSNPHRQLSCRICPSVKDFRGIKR
jgi:hypothetical protein